MWDRTDCHPAWMVIDLLRAESVPCPFEFLGERCGADIGERCSGSAGDDHKWTAPNGKTMLAMPAHMTRYGAADKTLGRRRPRPTKHEELTP